MKFNNIFALLLSLIIIIVGIILDKQGIVVMRGGAEKSYRNKFIEGLKSEGYKPREVEQVMKLIAQKPKNYKQVPRHIKQLPDMLDYREEDPRRNLYRHHIGQRKLLLNEVIFMTDYGHLSHTVVYAGAAHGIHTPMLAELFPEHKFKLWDPSNFAIKPTAQIEINNLFFTDDVAHSYAKGGSRYTGEAPLFISDIRLGSEDPDEFEGGVDRDNRAQFGWGKIMNAAKSMLKFRLPFNVNQYSYFDGEIWLQPWQPVGSTETRLITDGNAAKKIYTLRDDENRMFYLNNVLREFGFYKHHIPTDRTRGLCHCWDCAYEIWIWEHYLIKRDGKAPVDEIIRLIERASDIIGRTLRIGDHGKLPEEDMYSKRYKIFPPKTNQHSEH